ncbi:RNase p and RNase mrp subunit [Stagonosporopsis vannaccii]|nr:RNase p and RNase mrp subunit [Stagonosporopsis vannaccii]
MAPPTKKPSKPIFKTSSPFTETKWPSVSHEDQEVITELLCNLLSPLGDHRRAHGRPSRGKKRKRDANPSSDGIPRLPPPAIGSHVLIGLNSVTRHLETLAASTAPPTVPIKTSSVSAENHAVLEGDAVLQSHSPLKSLSIIVLTHPQPTLSPLHAHVPTLVHLATVRPNSEPKASESARLVALPTSNDTRFASALHIPRVGAIGIFDGAPGAKALEDYVREHVGLTECVWIEEANAPEWRGLNIQLA